MFDEIVESIINGSIDEPFLLLLAKEKRLSEVYEGKTIIDYILEYKRNTEEFDKYAIYNAEIAIKYLDYGLKTNIDSEEIFMSKFDDGKTFFEKYIENDFDAPFLNIISNLIKDGRTLKEILSCKIDNKYVFEHLEEKGLNLDITYMIVMNDENMVLNLIEKGYNIISRISRENLLKKINGELFLDIVIKKLLETGNIDFICSINYDSSLLTYKSNYLDNKMIIEYILENFKEKFNKDLMTQQVLLYMVDGKRTLLEHLIEKYRDFIIEWSKDNPLFSNPTFFSILKSNGITLEKMNLKLNTIHALDLVKPYLEKKYEERSNKEIPEEANTLIEEFRNLMLSDRKSSKNIIELACGSFREQFASGYEYAYRDLQTLIELKKRNPNFILRTERSSALTNRSIVGIDSFYIGSFNHEITHLLHWSINQYAVPVNFKDFMCLDSIQNERIASFIKIFHERLNSHRRNFESTLNIDTSSLLNLYYHRYQSIMVHGISEAQGDEFFSGCVEYSMKKMLSVEEFEMLFQKETKKEISSRLAFDDFEIEFALENIFDALSNGHFFINGIKLNEENIKLKIGHGIGYFKTTHPFIEVFACYGEIIKSPKKEIGLAILKDVMGQEFIDMLDEFYANMYLKDLDYKIEGESHRL